MIRTLVGSIRLAFITDLAFSPDGQFLIAGTTAAFPSLGTIFIWRLSDGTELRAFDAHESDVSAIAVSPNGQMFASGAYPRGLDEGVRAWSLPDGILLWERTGLGGGVHDLAYSSDGLFLAASARQPERVHLLLAQDGTPVQTLAHPNEHGFPGFNEIAWSPPMGSQPRSVDRLDRRLQAVMGRRYEGRHCRPQRALL